MLEISLILISVHTLSLTVLFNKFYVSTHLDKMVWLNVKTIAFLKSLDLYFFKPMSLRNFGREAVLTTTYLIYRMPSRVLKFKSPLKTFHSLYLTLQLVCRVPLKLFGCTAFVHVHPQNRGKLDARALKCIFVDYSTNQKGYKGFSLQHENSITPWMSHFFEDKPFFPNFAIQGEYDTHELQIGTG